MPLRPGTLSPLGREEEGPQARPAPGQTPPGLCGDASRLAPEEKARGAPGSPPSPRAPSEAPPPARAFQQRPAPARSPRVTSLRGGGTARGTPPQRVWEPKRGRSGSAPGGVAGDAVPRGPR